jgi:hypothetical protein
MTSKEIKSEVKRIENSLKKINLSKLEIAKLKSKLDILNINLRKIENQEAMEYLQNEEQTPATIKSIKDFKSDIEKLNREPSNFYIENDEDAGYLLKDENDEEVSNLSEQLSGIDEEPFIETNGSISATYNQAFIGLFSANGILIKKGLSKLKYVENRNEFIASINGKGEEDDEYEYFYENTDTQRDRDIYGIINEDGDIIVEFRFSEIEYDEDYGCYVCDFYANDKYGHALKKQRFYRDGQVLGDLVKELGWAIILQKNEKSFFLLSQEGTLSESYDWLSTDYTIELWDGFIAIIAKKEGKYGIIDHDNNIIVDFLYDEIKEGCFINPFKDGEPNYHEFIFTARLNGRIILKRLKNDDLVSDYLMCDGDDYKTIHINADEAPIIVVFNDYEFSVYKLLENHEFISSGRMEMVPNNSIAIFAINGKYGFIDKSKTRTPLLPFIYDSIETLSISSLPNHSKLGFLTSINDKSIFEILDYDYNYTNQYGSYRSILNDNNREQILETFKRMILDSIIVSPWRN